MGNGRPREGDLDHVLLRIGNALQDRFRNFSSLAQAIADGTLTVADNNQCGELHDAAAFDRLRNAVQVNNLFNQFGSVVRSFLIVSHLFFLLP